MIIFRQHISELPGLLLSGLIAAAVTHISNSLGGPAMLYALLVGMAFHFLSVNERLEAGIQLASRGVLRFGVALLGTRIVVADLLEIGSPTIALVLTAVLVTIVVGALIGRLCGLRGGHALLSACSVAVCGASAALAVSSVLPSSPTKERETILTVALVTAMSTIAMVAYPVVAKFLEFDNQTAGVFIGATIHDVAQVVGAGYMISDDTGDVSTVIKLLRVACLVPLVLTLSVLTRLKNGRTRSRGPLFPLFLLVFVFLVVMNSSGLIPVNVVSTLSQIASWCLLTAVAALGLKTDLGALVKVGSKPLIAMTIQTLVLAVVVIGGLLFLA